MEVITGGRQSGKTTKLIHKAAEEGGYIVCRNHKACSRIADYAERIGIDIPYPITYDEFITKSYYGPGVSRLYIDGVKELIERLSKSHVEIEAITIDIEE